MAMAHAAQFLVRHGDVVLFAWIFAEQAGLPIPTVPALLAAGSLASTGRMNFASSLALALAACLIADSFWYQMGRWHNARVLRLLCRISMAPDSYIRHIKAASSRHGAMVLLLAKFVPGVNFAIPPLAGTSGVSLLRFLLFDGLASVLWAGCYMMLGYKFGGQFESVAAYGGGFPTIGFVIFIAATAAFIGFRLMRNRQWVIPFRAREGSPAEHMKTKGQEARALGA
jgi:membrane protein DedA with SNARE-associated domain